MEDVLIWEDKMLEEFVLINCWGIMRKYKVSGYDCVFGFMLKNWCLCLMRLNYRWSFLLILGWLQENNENWFSHHCLLGNICVKLQFLSIFLLFVFKGLVDLFISDIIPFSPCTCQFSPSFSPFIYEISNEQLPLIPPYPSHPSISHSTDYSPQQSISPYS